MIKDITPERFRCGSGTCPAVHISEDRKTLKIVGTHIWHTQDRAEAMIEIPADLVREALKAAGGSDA